MPQQTEYTGTKDNVPIYIIQENSTFCQVFDVIILIMAPFVTCLNLYFIAFGFEELNPDSEDADSLDLNWLRTIVEYSEALFLLEICITFFKEYKDPETFEPVRSLKRISTHFIFHGEFISFLIAAFPYEIFARAMDDDP
jgi:hypothetical protein